MSTHDASFAVDFIIKEKEDEINISDLKVCELEEIIEDLTARAERADLLQRKVTELSMALDCLLREQRAQQQATAQWFNEAMTGSFDPMQGSFFPVPSNVTVSNPDLWYLPNA